jgi:hypothetical protein
MWGEGKGSVILPINGYNSKLETEKLTKKSVEIGPLNVLYMNCLSVLFMQVASDVFKLFFYF